jgi:hypothetical protein
MAVQELISSFEGDQDEQHVQGDEAVSGRGWMGTYFILS